MHRKRNVEIAVNCAVNEFDFENVTAFAVANLCDRARSDRLPGNPRGDVVRWRRRLCPRYNDRGSRNANDQQALQHRIRFYRSGTIPSRIDAAFQRSNPRSRDFESGSQEDGTRRPQRVEVGPLPSAWGQADPPLDFPAFLRF